MKPLRKLLPMFLLLFVLFISLPVNAYALTEEEVQQQVDAEGREAVSGNIFIWFLCAIAFLKVSQKIDSFMSSLGINVGHTGGSMLGEAMIAARALGIGKGGPHGSGGGSGHASGGSGGGASGGSGTSGGFLAGGLAGAVGRQASRSAAQKVTSAGDGAPGGISGRMFQSSMDKGGDFANGVIGSVAKGSISRTGSITGPTAARALSSYLGYTKPSGGSVGSGASPSGSSIPYPGRSSPASAPGLSGTDSGLGRTSTSIGGGFNGPSAPPYPGNSDLGAPDMDSPALGLSSVPSSSDSGGADSLDDFSFYTDIPETPEYTPPIGNSPDGTPEEQPPLTPPAGGGSVPSGTLPTEAETEPTEGNAPTGSTSPPPTPSTQSSVPRFENVEIGGGHITGTEYSSSHPGGIQFAMYHTDQYTAPDGEYSTVKAADGSKWYRQYAVNTVERSNPHRNEEEKIVYDEKIVKKLPKAPQRKDRI